MKLNTIRPRTVRELVHHHAALLLLELRSTLDRDSGVSWFALVERRMERLVREARKL